MACRNTDRGRGRARRTGQAARHQPLRDAPANVVKPGDPWCRRRRPNFTTCTTAPTGSTSASTSSSARCRLRPAAGPVAGVADRRGHRADHDRHGAAAGHLADAMIALNETAGFDLTVGTAEFGNGTSTVHRQIAATTLATDRRPHPPAPVRHRPWRPRHRRLWQRRASFVAGKATHAAAMQLASELKAAAARRMALRSSRAARSSAKPSSVACGGCPLWSWQSSRGERGQPFDRRRQYPAARRVRSASMSTAFASP